MEKQKEECKNQQQSKEYSNKKLQDLLENGKIKVISPSMMKKLKKFYANN